MSVHALVAAAAEERLPDWSDLSAERLGHVKRVATLMGVWADELGEDAVSWRAAGLLHDALREVEPSALRPRVPPVLARLPGPLLHGPAAAERLRVEGVADGSLLRAVAFHTLGHPDLDRLGRALYAADFLGPGRPLLTEWRSGLRERMPEDFDAVVREILAARIRYTVERGGALRPETLAFWNRMVEEAG